MRADGSLSCEHDGSTLEGSIHKVGALVQGQEACNGWTFWHIEDGKTLTLIDDLRDTVRRELAA